MVKKMKEYGDPYVQIGSDVIPPAVMKALYFDPEKLVASYPNSNKKKHNKIIVDEIDSYQWLGHIHW